MLKKSGDYWRIIGGLVLGVLLGLLSHLVSWGPEMLGQQVRWWDGEVRDYSPQPENLKQFFNSGSTSTHNINFSNANDRGTMRVSLTYQDHEAVVPNSNFDQYTFNLGANLKISDKLVGQFINPGRIFR